MKSNHTDIVGNRFGRLLVLERRPGSRWLCRCDCGKEKEFFGGNLKTGASRSCGCLRRELAENQYVDHTGVRFGRLIAKSRVENDRNGHVRWMCSCDCGNSTVGNAHHLVAGLKTSCGCYQAEDASRRFTTHGLTGTARFQMYHGAKSRAAAKGVPFKLCLDDVPEIPPICPLLGIPIKCGSRHADAESPTLDRIIPELGYIKGNVQIISRRANQIKNDASFDEFETMYKNWKARQ